MPVSIHVNSQISEGIGLINNTNKCIPNELIKSIYFTDIKNNDGLSLQWDKNKSYCYGDTRNAIIFEPCDKLQESESYIKIVFINNKILTTTHARKVTVL